jgi:RHS repeat-associated protein
MVAGTSALANGVTVGYSVDNDSRITGLTYRAGSSQLGNLIYGYDADGRVTSKGGTLAATNLPNSVTGNTFNADNGMTAFGGATLSYDANGNLTSDGTNTYTWDARNHLTAISGVTTASFTYDAFGRRASKTIAGTNTQFLYDILNPVQEIQAGAPSANLLTGGRLDEYFTRTDSSNNVSTVLTDAIGSTIGLVGSGQSIATNYTYQPFGGTTVAGAANGNSYQFTGRENDGTGLYYYRFRYYQPTFLRFVSQDPLNFLGGDVNLYAYVHANPVSEIDPFGLYCLSDAAINGIAGAVGGAFAGAMAGAETGPGAAFTIAGGAAAGAIIGYLSSNSLGNEVGLGAVGGGTSSGIQLNSVVAGGAGGAVGGAATWGAQQLGAPDYVSVPAGGAAGGAVGGALVPGLGLGAEGGAALGALGGGISGGAAVAVARALKAGNNCTKCGNSQ